MACIVCLPIAHQSDFIEHFAEEDIIALRMAEMFPEEEEGITRLRYHGITAMNLGVATFLFTLRYGALHRQ